MGSDYFLVPRNNRQPTPCERTYLSDPVRTRLEITELPTVDKALGVECQQRVGRAPVDRHGPRKEGVGDFFGDVSFIVPVFERDNLLQVFHADQTFQARNKNKNVFVFNDCEMIEVPGAVQVTTPPGVL